MFLQHFLLYLSVVSMNQALKLVCLKLKNQNNLSFRHTNNNRTSNLFQSTYLNLSKFHHSYFYLRYSNKLPDVILEKYKLRNNNVTRTVSKTCEEFLINNGSQK